MTAIEAQLRHVAEFTKLENIGLACFAHGFDTDWEDLAWRAWEANSSAEHFLNACAPDLTAWTPVQRTMLKVLLDDAHASHVALAASLTPERRARLERAITLMNGTVDARLAKMLSVV